MDRLYGFDSIDAGRIGNSVRAYEAGFANRLPQFGSEAGPWQPTIVRFRNDNSGTAPAHGVLRVTDVVLIDGVPHLTIDKPNTSFQRLYLVNGDDDIQSGGTGWGFRLTDHDGYVLYDSGSGTPAYGECWGPQNGTWTLKKWRYGFTIMGGNATDPTRTVAVQEFVNLFRGKTDAAHAKSATGTISIYDGDSVDTTDNMASVLNDYADLAISKWVDVVWKGGKWTLAAGECA